MAKMEGTVYSPPLYGMSLTVESPSTSAAQELVVPRSMPMIGSLLITRSSVVRPGNCTPSSSMLSDGKPGSTHTYLVCQANRLGIQHPTEDWHATDAPGTSL